MTGNETFFKYVPIGFVHVWEAAGWKAVPALRGTHHGDYSELMQWTGSGPAVCPQEVAA